MVPAHARPLAHRAGADGGSLPRLSVQLRLPRDDAGHPVGAGLGDDHAGRARVPADACGDRLWRRDDRRAQSFRPGQRGVARRVRSDLVDPARAGHRDRPAGVRRVRRVSDRAVDRCDGCGLRAGAGLRLGSSAEETIPAQARPAAGARVPRPPRHQRLRQSGAVEPRSRRRSGRCSRSSTRTSIRLRCCIC